MMDNSKWFKKITEAEWDSIEAEMRGFLWTWVTTNKLIRKGLLLSDASASFINDLNSMKEGLPNLIMSEQLVVQLTKYLQNKSKSILSRRFEFEYLSIKKNNSVTLAANDLGFRILSKSKEFSHGTIINNPWIAVTYSGYFRQNIVTIKYTRAIAGAKCISFIYSADTDIYYCRVWEKVVGADDAYYKCDDLLGLTKLIDSVIEW